MSCVMKDINRQNKGNNQPNRVDIHITGSNPNSRGMIEPGMVVERRMGWISGEEPQLMVE